jgi:hypothetical protein
VNPHRHQVCVPADGLQGRAQLMPHLGQEPGERRMRVLDGQPRCIRRIGSSHLAERTEKQELRDGLLADGR